jgi:hypothetical protein
MLPSKVASGGTRGDSALTRNLYGSLLARISEAHKGLETSSSHHLAYKIHDGLVLSGFLLDLSGLERGAFFLTALSHPLYVPRNYLVLTYGKRLKRGKRWKIESHNETEITDRVLEVIRSEGCSFLEMVNSTRKLDELAEAKPGTRKNPFGWHEKDPNMTEVRAYSWTLLGNDKRAKRDLRYLTQKYVPAYDWGRALQNRSAKVLNAMDEGIEAAQALLRAWAKQTTADLGLNEPGMWPR